MKYPKDVEAVIDLLTDLPGVGRRSAERMIFAFLRWDHSKLRALGSLIGGLPESVRKCAKCGNIADSELCAICSNPLRDAASICVVEDSTQIPTLEKSALFKGHYHVLGGKLSPLDGKGAEHLAIAQLLQRVKDTANPIREVIMALSPDVEGRATAIYLADLLKDTGVVVSALAQGIPAGADITFANSATIAAALMGRTMVTPLSAFPAPHTVSTPPPTPVSVSTETSTPLQGGPIALPS